MNCSHSRIHVFDFGSLPAARGRLATCCNGAAHCGTGALALREIPVGATVAIALNAVCELQSFPHSCVTRAVVFGSLPATRPCCNGAAHCGAFVLFPSFLYPHAFVVMVTLPPSDLVQVATCCSGVLFCGGNFTSISIHAVMALSSPPPAILVCSNLLQAVVLLSLLCIVKLLLPSLIFVVL